MTCDNCRTRETTWGRLCDPCRKTYDEVCRCVAERDCPGIALGGRPCRHVKAEVSA